MRPFSAKERKEIADAITAAEAKTSGEIVVVAANASGGYYANALMWAAIAALSVPLPLIHATQMPIEYIYLIQLGVFLVGAMLTQWESYRFAIVPAGVKRARAHQRAVEQFLVQNMHTTEGRTGVLIYVSFAEHYVEVIADNGIYKKVPYQIWEGVVTKLTHHLARGERAKGLVEAIATCGKVLAQHFPPDQGHKDELPNHLIVLDGYRGY
jgi:putative membrane protein